MCLQVEFPFPLSGKIGQFKQYLLQKEPDLIKLCMNKKSGQIMKKFQQNLILVIDFVYVKHYIFN